MNIPGPLHVITQALVSAASVSSHNTQQDLCDLSLE
jgi:hypothetical protein